MEEGEMSAATEKEEEMSGEAGKEGKGKPDGEPDGEHGIKKTLSLPTISDMSSPWRWRVSYSTKRLERRTATYEGSILLQPEVNRIVLLDADEMAVIDARYLKEGELIYPGSVLQFACHKVDVGERIIQPDACIEDELITLSPVTSPQQMSSAREPKFPSNEEDAILVDDGEGHLLGNANERVVDKEKHLPSKRTKQNKKDDKKRKDDIRKESGEEEREGDLLRYADERGVDNEKEPTSKRTKQERMDDKKRKRLEVEETRKMKTSIGNSEWAEELRRKNQETIKKIKKEKHTVRSPGVKLTRSPMDMFARVASLRKKMSPQAKQRKPEPLVTVHFPSPPTPSSGATLSRGSAQRPRKLKSKIWNEVILIYKHGKLVEGQCKHCNDIFAASRSSGTNHIHRHLRICETRSRMHELVAKMCASASSPQVVGLGKWEFNQAKSRRELANMVTLHDFPFSIVEYSGFQKFVKSLNPLFILVSRTTVKEDCMESFREQRSALREEFKTCGSRVSLTANMWTSVQRLGYLCITCHFIDKTWKIQKRIIRFCLMETPHDGLQMYNVMLKSIQYWNIEDKICSITLDNASVNGSMMNHLRDNLFKRHLLICEGAIFHIRCAAHVLNLIVQDGLLVMKGVIDNIRESVKYIKSSQSREDLFEDVVVKLGIKCKKKPSLDVSSRWNSTYLMIESALPYQEVFVELGKQDRQFTFAPSEDEWNMAEEIRKLLETFCAATKVLSGSSYPTSNRYFHEIWNVKVLLNKQAKNKNEVIASMVAEMQKKFDKYWKESFLANCIPVIMDPRYKHGFVEFRLKQAFGNNAGEHLAKVDKAIKKLFEEYSLKMGDLVADHSEEQVDVDMVPEVDNPLADWEAHLKVQKKQVTSELDRHLSEDLFPPKKDFDILRWWEMHAPKYPILSCIARDVLAVQASNVASESAFSIGGRVVSDYRSRLTSDTVEALICLQDWLRAAEPSRLRTTATDLDDEDCQLTPNVVQSTHKGATKMPTKVRSPVERRDRAVTAERDR